MPRSNDRAKCTCSLSKEQQVWVCLLSKEVASCWQETHFPAFNNQQRSCRADWEFCCMAVQPNTVPEFLASKAANCSCYRDEPHRSGLVKPWEWNDFSGTTQSNDSCPQQWGFAGLGPITVGWFECCTLEISKGPLCLWFRFHKTAVDGCEAKCEASEPPSTVLHWAMGSTN